MEKTAFILYLLAIVLSVLFFGAIHTWAYTIVFLVVIAASLLTLKGTVVRMDAPLPAKAPKRTGDVPPAPGGENGGGKRSAKSLLYLRWVQTDLDPLFFFFMALLLFQMTPLPPWLLGLLSPESKLAGEMSRPAAASLDPESLKGHWYAIAPYLYPVRMSLVRWTVYGLLFFGLVRCLNSRKRIEATVATILVLAAFDSLYGIMQTYSGFHRVWWFKSGVYGKDVSGTFLSRNLFAGFLELTITLAAAYAAGLAGAGGEDTAPPRRRTLAMRFLAFFSDHPKNLKRFLIVFAGGVMGLGLILSSSRGGIIAMAGTLLMMGLIFYFRKSQRRSGRIILSLFAIAMVFAVHAGLDYTVGRFYFFDESMKDRGIMAEKALHLFNDYGIAGVGIGNFRHAYGRYQDPVHKNLYVDFAHNDYAQFIAEAGTTGAVILLAGVGWFVVRTIRTWRKRHDPFAVCLGIVPLAALFAVAVHAYSEYNLHRPAHMMVLVAVIAVGYASLQLERGRRHPRTIYPERLLRMRPWGAILLAGAGALTLWSGLWTVRHFVAETHCNTDYNITMNLEENPSVESARTAKGWNPGNAVYPFKTATALMALRNMGMQGPVQDLEGWKKSHDAIIAELEEAIRLNPLNPEYHIGLAWEYSYLWDRRDYAAKWFPAADLSLDRAAYFAGGWPQNPKLHYDMGKYWTMRAKSLKPGDPRREASLAKAARHYRKGMELEQVKELPKDVLTYIEYFFPGNPL